MFNLKRIKAIEEKFQKLEWELRDQIWLIKNPPKYKHGDKLSYWERTLGSETKIDELTIVAEKNLLNSMHKEYYFNPVRIYFAIWGDSTILEVREPLLHPIPQKTP